MEQPRCVMRPAKQDQLLREPADCRLHLCCGCVVAPSRVSFFRAMRAAGKRATGGKQDGVADGLGGRRWVLRSSNSDHNFWHLVA